MITRGATGTLQFDDTTVFSGSGTVGSFIDLDLSSVVGSNHAIVIVSITPSSANYVKLQPKGGSYGWDTNERHCCMGYFTTGETGILIAETDSSGVCEMRVLTGAPNTIVIKMVAFWVA